MKTDIRSALASVRRSARSKALRARLRVLQDEDSPTVRAVGTGLARALDGPRTEEERAWVQRIERRRKRLLAVRETIPTIDYGAGDADNPRSREEMAVGVPGQRRVRDLCRASKPPFWAHLMMQLAAALQPRTAVELGSGVGISAAYLAAGLTMNGQGRLFTLEGSPETAKLAAQTLSELGLDNGEVVVGPFDRTLEAVLQRSESVNLLFNDGHHDRDALLRYFDTSLPFTTEGSVMIFDDIRWSSGMNEGWSAVRSHPGVAISIDLGPVGVLVLGSDEGPGKEVDLRF